MRDKPNFFSGQPSAAKVGQLCQTVKTIYLRSAILNLTQGTYHLMRREGGSFVGAPAEGCHDELLASIFSLTHPEDRDDLSRFLSREHLLQVLTAGQTELQLEYRQTLGGDYRWVEICILRLDDPAEKDVLAALLLHDINELQQTEKQLRIALDAASGELEKKCYYQDLINTVVPVETLLSPLAGESLSYIGGGLLHQFGYTLDEFSEFHRNGLRGLVHPDDLPKAQALGCAAAAERSPAYEQEFRILRKDGGVAWILEKSRLTQDADGAPAYLSVYIDITERKTAEEALRIREEEIRVAMSRMGRLYCRYDVAAQTLVLPPQYATLYQLPETVTCFPPEVLLSAPLRFYAALCRRILQGEQTGFLVAHMECPSGNQRWEKMEFVTIRDDDGNPVRAIISVEDVTAEKTSMLEMLRRARSDGMTGLLNKTAAEELAAQWLSRNAGVSCAMLVVDLDNLKSINDTLGHIQGDRALRLLSETLRKHFRSTDLIGRVGGDEFMVFLPGLSNAPRLHNSLAALVHRLSTLRIGEQNNHPFRASIGAVLGTGGTDSYNDLFKRADSALYRVKRNGKNSYALYEPKVRLKN
ncbi:MAG: diguanylate cyclase [Clostridiaceae bacterium]|nr:diguanylate cyclase [Clostridiaceae bacterium]